MAELHTLYYIMFHMQLILKTCLNNRLDDLILKQRLQTTIYNTAKLPKGLHRTFQNSLLFNYNVGTVSKT